MKKHGHAIVLIGFMGAGKSSVGRTLARMTGRPRFDTDEMIAIRFGLTISQIFERRGEERFRDAESEVLGELSSETDAIIVTGGGIVLRETNTARLRELGSVIFLSADHETLVRRISRRPTRPLLQTTDPRETMKELLVARQPLYRAAADLEVDTTGLTHDEVARSILKKVEDNERRGIEPEG
jgi:shikimate kinase